MEHFGFNLGEFIQAFVIFLGAYFGSKHGSINANK